ncbi:MarR family winged helix-turn-helix transcriptional regulator [Kitasatospora cineracea]|uniref:DNA-binding MarR family transcriptional regulator n=1 Tax=Kitasatospora cineracea TaxID=88074 RepID=A0A3N4S0S4_9ACTN|nr:MarR family transcriptional regulator [Kitasatospora cineracea]ROR46740.1 DNA-binding MarR family transcriptional regulator [Kitasatospora cineracea]RPE36911.1 DNA-binding MarR family transcriptional regulator [Kitasatospora cineracea]
MSEDSEPAAEPAPSAVHASQRVRSVIGKLRRRIRAAAGTGDFTLTQASTVGRLLDSTGGLTTSDLAVAEGMRHQSMATTIAALAAEGLVERQRDPEDGRRLLIALTPEGRRRAEEGRRARGEWLAAELQRKCTEEERQTVIAAMAVLERLVQD